MVFDDNITWIMVYFAIIFSQIGLSFYCSILNDIMMEANKLTNNCKLSLPDFLTKHSCFQSLNPITVIWLW